MENPRTDSPPKNGDHFLIEHPRGGITAAHFDGKKFIRADGADIEEPKRWSPLPD